MDNRKVKQLGLLRIVLRGVLGTNTEMKHPKTHVKVKEKFDIVAMEKAKVKEKFDIVAMEKAKSMTLNEVVQTIANVETSIDGLATSIQHLKDLPAMSIDDALTQIARRRR